MIFTERDGIKGYTTTGFDYTSGGAMRYTLSFTKAFEGNEFKQPKTGSFEVQIPEGDLMENAFQVSFEDNESGMTYADSAALGSVIITENRENFLRGSFELTLVNRETGNEVELKNGKFTAVKDTGFSSL